MAKDFWKQNNNQHRSNHGNYGGGQQNYRPKGDANAPYNFVPLNDRVVAGTGCPDLSLYHADRFTGVITVTAKTQSEVFIRSSHEAQGDQFFSHDGRFCIPGSSLRGLIRSTVEMISYSEMKIIDDKNLYFRGFAGKDKNLRNSYAAYGLSSMGNNGPQYMGHAGLLYRKGRKFFIKDCGQPGRIPISQARNLVRNYRRFDAFQVTEGLGAPYWIVASGLMRGKEKDWKVIPPRDDKYKTIELTDKDVEHYRNDTLRSDDVPNLLEKAKDHEYPCFFVQTHDDQNNPLIIFGHTAMMRVPYKKSIKELIPQQKNAKAFDIAESVFGNETEFAGRVFFEDAYCTTPGNPYSDQASSICLPLLSPKPTSFQLYLKQNDPNNLNNYNSKGARIRGSKLYWHKAPKWKKPDQNRKEKFESKIRPVKKDIEFKGSVRFENLTAVELGALLAALELPQGCAHKIGMAKPYGLGSIHLSAKLFLSDRVQRYSSFEAELQPKDADNKKEELKNAFATCIVQALKTGDACTISDYSRLDDVYSRGNGEHLKTGDACTISDYWNKDKRMIQLKHMLTLDNKLNPLSISYMSLNEKRFQDREVLPYPDKVK